MKEVWKTIEEFHNYLISNFGRIKNKKGLILKQRKDNYGYWIINLYKNQKKRTKKIHILMYETYISKIPEGYIIHHKDNTKNNFLENIELMMINKHNKLHSNGESNPNSKLKEQDVIQIKILLKDGNLTQREIAKKFNINETNIYQIKKQKIWRHIVI